MNIFFKKIFLIGLSVFLCFSTVVSVNAEETIEYKGNQELFYPIEVKEELSYDWSNREISIYSNKEDINELYFRLNDMIRETFLNGEDIIDISSLYLDTTEYEDILEIANFSPYFYNGMKVVFWSSQGIFTRIEVRHSLSKEKIKQMVYDVDEEIENILSLVNDDMSDEKKAVIIHDYLVYRCKYNNEGLSNGTLISDDYSCGGMLMNKTGVCSGYAFAFSYLMNLLGIECHVTTSKAMNHAWNIININGKYYHVDCTWDDPVEDSLGQVNHRYLFASDETIQNQNHYGWDLSQYVCDDKSLEHVYWVDAETQIITYEGYEYYVIFDYPNRINSIMKRNMANGQIERIVNLGRWPVWESEDYYWTGPFSGLFLSNERLYYNSSTQIISCDLDGQNQKVEFEADSTIGYIFGIRDSGAKIEYSLKTSPNDIDNILLTNDLLKAEVTDIQLDITSCEMKIGDSIQLKAMIEPIDAANQSLSWNSTNQNVATVDQNGLVQALAKGTTTVTVTTSNGLTAACKVTVVSSKLPFIDVNKYDWFYDEVKYVYDRGMMSGYGNMFSPQGNMTRSMIVSTLYRLEGSPEVTDKTAETIFSDVASGEWYTDAVNWAYSTGVTVGYPDRMMFGTYDNVTREQLAVFLYRYAETRGYDVSARKDLSEYRGYEQTSEYAIEAMQWATATGLITGSRVEENGEYVYYLLPGGNATRAQFASILMRFCEYYEIK